MTATTSTNSPSRHLLSGSLGYVPQGCSNIIVSVAAQESDPSWFQEAPEIRGTVTLQNPNTFNIPIDNIIIRARSSDGMFYSTVAQCDGGSGVLVPYNPQIYSYGTATCSFRLVLDRNVFGRYASADGSGKRRLLGGYGYFPSPDQRPSWTIVAVATISYSNAQCSSGPTPVNTDCWWTWLEGWHRRHHHHFWFGGRKLLSMAAQGEGAGIEQQKTKLASDSHDGGAVQKATSRHLLSNNGLDNCYGLIQPNGFIQANVDGSYAAVGRVTLQNPSPVPLPLSSIKVTIANTVAYRPLFVNADCHGATAVPAFSSITCNYAVDLPSDGQSANPAVWTTMAATAMVGSNVACTSPAINMINTTSG